MDGNRPPAIDSRPTLQLSHADPFSHEVEAYLDDRSEVERAMPRPEPVSRFSTWLHTNWAYLSLAGGLGGILAWFLIEPRISEQTIGQPGTELVGFLLFPTVSGAVGMLLGLADGILCRNLGRAFLCSLVGLGVGFGAGLFTGFAAEIVFAIGATIAASTLANPGVAARPTGITLV